MWWEKANATYQPPYVFESDKKISAETAPIDVKKLKTSVVPVSLIGEKISITGEKVAIPFPSESCRNIAIVGSSDAEVSNGDGIIQGIALSLAAGQKQSRFLFCDFRGKEEPMEVKYSAFTKALANLGISIEYMKVAMRIKMIV